VDTTAPLTYGLPGVLVLSPLAMYDWSGSDDPIDLVTET
jgi:hypothetical protein